MPAGREWTPDERARWVELWESPQATQWDDTGRGTVAVLVVYESAIFAGTASAWQAQEARYATEALGLTPRALASLGGGSSMSERRAARRTHTRAGERLYLGNELPPDLAAGPCIEDWGTTAPPHTHWAWFRVLRNWQDAVDA